MDLQQVYKTAFGERNTSPFNKNGGGMGKTKSTNETMREREEQVLVLYYMLYI